MNIKHKRIEINKEKPFLNCKLGREPYAKILTDIVSRYKSGFVLAINNEWGFGKTTFVKMWEQYLLIQGFQTSYFNAWENDFDSNPMIALMSELQKLKIEGDAEAEEKFKKVLSKGVVLIKNLIPLIGKAILKRYIPDLDKIGEESIDKITEATGEILAHEIKEFTIKKDTIKEFKSALKDFIQNKNLGKPLIFIIDELDRCRPNYAVEVLEHIKHFFSVEGIIFVLSIDKKHLGSSIKGFYGSDKIETDEYLRRFIDLEFSLPQPSNREYIGYLYEHFNFYGPKNEAEDLINIAQFLFIGKQTNLRQLEKIFSLTKIASLCFKENELKFLNILFLLVYVKILKPELYIEIERKSLSTNEFVSKFDKEIWENCKFENSGVNLCRIYTYIIWFYNNGLQHTNRITLYRENSKGDLSSSLSSILPNSEQRFGQYFHALDREIFSHFELEYFLNKINLSETIKQ